MNTILIILSSLFGQYPIEQYQYPIYQYPIYQYPIEQYQYQPAYDQIYVRYNEPVKRCIPKPDCTPEVVSKLVPIPNPIASNTEKKTATPKQSINNVVIKPLLIMDRSKPIEVVSEKIQIQKEVEKGFKRPSEMLK